MRLSILGTKLLPLSRRKLKEAITKGKITVNGKVVKKDIQVTNSDNIDYIENIVKPDFNIKDYLIKSYNSIIFLYKPPLMHSDRHTPEESLTMEDIINSFSGYKGLSRLDYEVDGVIAAVSKELQIKFIKKEYLAIVEGKFPKKLNTKYSIDADNKKKVLVKDDNQGYFTSFHLIKYNGKNSLIKIELEKAARHQVRALCSYLGYPILGDTLYGSTNYQRLALHCNKYFINQYFANSSPFQEKFITLIDL